LSLPQLRSIAPAFDPTRLRVARQASGLTRSELAVKLEVSAAAVSQYENGTSRPSPGTLARIALILRFPTEFFASTGEAPPDLDTATTFFRSLRSTSQRERDQAIAHAALVYHAVERLSLKVVLPPVALPEHHDIDLTDGNVIEDIARDVRAAWNLADVPVPHLVRQLEASGIVVTRFVLGGKRIDAFSRRFPLRPVVVLGDDKGLACRSRFDAAHELGHLVMHADPEPGSRLQEKQAHHFAAALLMPREALEDHLPRQRVDWLRLIELKRIWGVSLAALLYRAKEVGTLSQTGYESALKTMARRGWRTNEPGDVGRPERPALLHRATQLLKENGMTEAEVADLMQITASRLNELIGAESEERLVLT
jgi:Zn-dependent peptidase ImmA (M78 family)/DNA-binding XRE family transcriptional regulator